MTSIDKNAVVAAGASVGRDVTIGPFCVIGPNVTIGDGCKLLSHVNVAGHTTIGPRTTVYPFSSLGTQPQSVRYRGGPTRLVIGAECEIRESVTMNTGTEDDRGVTEVGNNCFFMVGSHVGHDCKVGSNVTMANNAVLGGHVVVEDHVVFGGHSAVHQFVRIGEGAMIAGVTGVGADIIPYGFAIGQRGFLDGLNVVGLRRRGYSRFDIQRLRHAYRGLFMAPGHHKERLEAVAKEFGSDALVGKVIDFIRGGGSRPLMKAWQTSDVRSDSESQAPA
ncbi:MAG: acyl-ACP--UDP-N-acetylglucosamine O-acyltransferase [Pseudorhodoplanes sp.]